MESNYELYSDFFFGRRRHRRRHIIIYVNKFLV